MPRVVTPNAAHIKFMDDLKAALAQNTDLNGQEMLAIASQFIGMLIAAQDRHTVSPAMAEAIVFKNIEIGNAAAVAAQERE